MAEKAKVSKWLPWIAAMAIFMQSLDGTILNTALPTIARDLDKSPLEMQSTIIAYALTLALFIPLSGFLSDRFGARNIFVLSIFIFTFGSFACALSTNLPMLVCCRILQAVGGSMMVPVSRLTLIYSYPRNRLLEIMNFITMPGLVGLVIGPLLGGWLVQIATWQWIFLINIPIGMVGMIAAGKIFPNYTRPKRKFDFLGLILFGIGLVMLSLSLEFAGDGLGTAKNILISFIVGIVMLSLYVPYSLHAYNPLIDLKTLKIRTLRIGLLGNLATRLGIGGVPLMLPLMLQVGFGKSPSIAGMMLMFSAITVIIAKYWVVPLIQRFGYRNLLFSNTLILGIIIAAFALLNAEMPLFYMIPILIAYGAFNSIQMTSMNTIALADLTSKTASMGNTMVSIMQQLSISFGVSLSSMILRGFNISHIFGNIEWAFKATFITLGAITAVSAFMFRYLKPSDGKAISGE
jgi:EmrB/QacA subfamily drug resistance transporter